MFKRNKNLNYNIALSIAYLVLICSCQKTHILRPTITTTGISTITLTTAVCGGIIVTDGGEADLKCGVCWGKSVDPIISENSTCYGNIIGDGFTARIIGLTLNSTYYARAFATNSAGTCYGKSVSFTTENYGPIVTDIDGNSYNTVTIGTQVWMVENLKTTRYCDGTYIPNVSYGNLSDSLSTGAYCDYHNDATHSQTYGRLYNWYAAYDSRKIAPKGWHVPTDYDWTILENFLGGAEVAGGKLKESGMAHWQSPNTNATNETGFAALPGIDDGYNGGWWTYTNCSS